MEKKKVFKIGGVSCLVVILLLGAMSLGAVFVYKNYSTIKGVINVFSPDVVETQNDAVSEQEAINALLALAEAQSSYFSQSKAYAQSIKELGYMHNEPRGYITKKAVWQADADSKDSVALGASSSEYVLKVIALNDPTCEVGYIAIAIAQKENLATYAFYVDKAQASIMGARAIDIFRIFDLATIRKLEQDALMLGVINKNFLAEIAKDPTKVQLIEDFKLPENINKIR